MSKKGVIFILSGPSGVGKTTVEKQLLKLCRNLKPSISATTRCRRKGEKNGRDYLFFSKEYFLKLKKQNGFLESAKVFNNLYGTPREYVFEKLDKGKDILLTIDVQGALKVKRKIKEVVMIFLMPPSLTILKKRLIKRGTDCREDIEKRLALAKEEISHAVKYDYIVVNEKINKTINEIIAIINVEKLKTFRSKEIINGLYSS